MMLSQVSRGIAIGLLVAMPTTMAAGQEQGSDPADAAVPHPPPSAGPGDRTDSHQDIRQWISDLDSNHYEVRERASRRLLEHGGAAVEQLAAAADGPSPEAAARAIVVLEELAKKEDQPKLQLAVLEHLAGLENRASVSRRAQEKLAEVWERISLPIVLEMGARLDPESEYVDPSGQRRKVILGPNWTGGDEGLVHVARLASVYAVSIRNAAVSPEGLEHLAEMPSLQVLELYGIGLDEEARQELRQKFPYVRLDIRRGAMLGVRGLPQSPAQVQSVEPDSAADHAELQAGDVIIKVDDAEVQSFDELTREIAKFHPGETAVLHIRRGGELLEREVVFGQWE